MKSGRIDNGLDGGLEPWPESYQYGDFVGFT